jgi:hypothetical protein
MALGWMGSTTAFGAVVRKPYTKCRPGTGLDFVPRGYGVCCWLRLALSGFKTSDISALMNDEPIKWAPPNRVSPTASARQTTQPMISRLDNPSNIERSLRRDGLAHLHFVEDERKRFIVLSLSMSKTVTSRHMNRTAPEGVQGLLLVL